MTTGRWPGSPGRSTGDVDMVMVSSAIYAKIDGRSPATFSRTVITG